MKKVLDLLEKNVQWFALGLAVIYVLWMAWTYVLQSPVTVKVSNETLAPKDVDKYILDGVGTSLQNKMNDPRVPTIPSPKWVQAFRDEMSYKDRLATPFKTPMFRWDLTEKLDFRPDRGIEAPREIYVQALPTIPVAVMGAARSGMSNVAIPAALAQAPAGDVQAVAALQEGKDILWITQIYILPTGELARAFQDVKLPVDQFKTTVFEANLERQEILPDGSEGPVTRIKPLPTVQLQPIPDPKTSVAVKTAFLLWANTHVTDILQPPFYTVVVGDLWSPPGQAALPVAPQNPQQPQQPQDIFDPSKWVNATLDEMKKAGLTQDQIRKVALYRQKVKDDERKGKNSGKGGGKGGVGGGGFGGKGGGGPGFGPDDGGRGGRDGGSQEGGFIDPGAFEGGTRPPAGERPPEDGNPPQAQAPQTPPGEFDPRETPDIVGWAHDDTVEPGKTYRYRIQYKIKSPVWNTTNMTKPQELASTFVLESKFSEWGDPISVPSLTSFFVIRPAMGGDRATVQVFRWHGGATKQKSFDVSPGDAIGLKDGDVDFSTGWTMVDMRLDPRTDERYVMLMDPAGRIQTRDFRSDQNNPERKKKEAEAAAATAAGAPSDAVAGTR